jgi:hypothetical protein
VAATHHLDLDNAGLGGIAAVSANDVWATGATRVTGGSRVVPLIEHYNGTVWCAVDSHNWAGDPLDAVTAVSARDVWAVGYQIEHWDGHIWSVVPTPPTPVTPTYAPRPLTAVSASSGNNVWALSSGGHYVERWDGQRWRLVPLPKAAAIISYPLQTGPQAPLANPAFEAIATLSLTDTWVVGESGPLGLYPWAMHWDGKQWQEMTMPRSPAPASYGADLQETCESTDGAYFSLPGIAALSHDDVWVVASQVDDPSGEGRCPLAFHWDGKAWHEEWLATSPKDVALLERTYTTQHGFAWDLQVMAATPGGDIWAMSDPEEVALHWDGHSWHAVSAFTGPKTTYYQPDLTGMSAASANDVWAVSEAQPTPWNAYHWDGTHWRGVLALPAG